MNIESHLQCSFHGGMADSTRDAEQKSEELFGMPKKLTETATQLDTYPISADLARTIKAEYGRSAHGGMISHCTAS